MPSNALSNLNVRLGFIFDDRSLRGVERRLQASGQRLSQLGSAMTLSISAPLALLGAGAVKAAGEFESMELAMRATFANAGRTAAEANAELEALRKAAQAPGLDVPQAIQGSIRLQSVGLRAEEARGTIVELANAIASTGGTAQNLDSVTVQFSQMISKGKVLAQDLRIVQENLPIISDLMLKAFGTSNAENIQKLGITGKEFVTRITAEMSKLTRVEGGITNSIVNAGTAIKVFLATIGNEINKAFNIKDAGQAFSDALQSAAEAFAGLSDGTKRFIVEIGLALIALGPIVKIFGVIKLAGAQVVSVYALIGKGLKALTSVAATAEIAMSRLKVALGIVGVVVALVAAFYALAGNVDAATFAADKYKDAQKEIIAQTSKEIGVINKNFAALKDETKSRFEKGKIVDELLKQYPEYLKGLDLEGASVERLTEIQNRLNSSILRGVAERQKSIAVESIYAKQAETILRIQQLREGANATASESTLINTGDMFRAGSIAGAVIIKLEQQSKDLGDQANKLAGEFDRAFGTIGGAANQIDPALQAEYALRDAYYEARDASEENTKSIGKNTEGIKEAAKAAKLLKEVLSDIANERARQDLLGASDIEAEATAIENGLKRLLDGGFAPMSAAVQNLKNELKGLFDSQKIADFTPLAPPTLPDSVSSDGSSSDPSGPKGVDASKIKDVLSYSQQLGAINVQMQDGLIGFNSAFEQTAQLVTAQGSLMEQVFMGMGQAIQEAALSGETSFEKLGLAAAGAAAKIVRAYIQQGVAAAVAKALGSLPFPLNLAAGAAAGGIAAALFTKAINAIGVPKFASGTRRAPGGLALVGEAGPELVNLPERSQVYSANQTRGILRGVGDSGGANVNVSGNFRIAGTDLVVVLEKVQSKNQRRF